MQKTPVVEYCDRAWFQLYDHSVFQTFQLLSENPQIVVELTNVLRACVGKVRHAIGVVIANHYDLLADWIQFENRRCVHVMAPFFLVFESDWNCAQSLEGFRMFAFDFISNAKAVDEERFTAFTIVIEAMQDLSSRLVTEVGVFSMWTNVSLEKIKIKFPILLFINNSYNRHKPSLYEYDHS